MPPSGLPDPISWSLDNALQNLLDTDATARPWPDAFNGGVIDDAQQGTRGTAGALLSGSYGRWSFPSILISRIAHEGPTRGVPYASRSAWVSVSSGPSSLRQSGQIPMNSNR